MAKTFEEIARIDVSEHIEKKANLSYLSWSWAHAEMKKIDPMAKVLVHEFPEYIAVGDTVQTIFKPYLNDNGGAWVKVSVTMNDITETEYLPIMDFKNKSVANPDSMSVNKAIKRCFVKALALHGLGLYIYSGEDLPEVEPPKPATASQKSMLTKQLEEVSKHIGKSYENTEKIVMKKEGITGRYDNITNEDYGKMMNYVKELLDYYFKNPAESKANQTNEKTTVKAEAEQVGMDMQYNIPEK